MPRIHPRTGALAMGIGGGPASIAGKQIAPVGGGCSWLDDETAIYGAPEGVTAYHVPTKTPRVLDPRSPNGLEAAGGQWVAFRPDSGVYGSLVKPQAGLTRSANQIGMVGVDGTLGITPVYQAAAALQLHAKDGRMRDIPGAVFWDPHIVSFDAVIWDGLDGHCYVDGLSAPLEFGDLGQRFRYVVTPSGPWLVYFSRRWGVVARPADSREGVVLANVSHVSPAAMFHHDAAWVDGLGLVVAWSAGNGELPHEGVRVDHVETLARVDLTPPVDVPAVNRALWCGWFEFAAPPTLPPGNALLRIYRGGSLASFTGQPIGQWVQGSSVAEISVLAAQTAEPPIAYWDARRWPSWPTLPQDGYLGMQAYCRASEPPEQFEASIRAELARVPAGYRVALVCQCYTSNASLTTDLAGLVPVYARLARDIPAIEMLLVFSDYGRGTGLSDHPEVRPLWAELAATVTVPSHEDTMPLKAPGITVDRYSPEFKDGWEIVFHDRNNPEVGTYRVWRENGSLRVSSTMPSGSDMTGSARLVNCPGGSTPPPDPVPVPPDPVPQPPQNDKVWIKHGARYVALNAEKEWILSDTQKQAFVLEALGGGKLTFRANGNSTAAEPPDGVLQSDRGDPGDWERFTQTSQGNKFAFKADSTGKYIRIANDQIRANGAAINAETTFELEPATVEQDLSAVHTNGPLFRFADNRRYYWAHVTAFSAFSDWLKGDTGKLESYAQWTRDVGANGWRVFGNWSRLALDFRNVPSYFGHLAAFCEWTASQGLRLEFTAICDYIPRDPSEEQRFTNDVASVLRNYPHVFHEYANEVWQNATLSDRQVVVPDGVLFCRGSSQTNDGLQPPEDYYTAMPNGAAYSAYHSPRDAEFYRKGKDLFEIYYSYPGVKGPVVDNEPTRVDLTSGDRGQWWVAGCTRSMFGAGATFHGGANTLQLCNVPSGTEDACAREFFKGLFAVPPDAPAWTYGRYGEAAPPTPHVIADQPGALRVYEMTGGNQACAIAIDGSRPTPINGWRAVKYDGPNECFVILER